MRLSLSKLHRQLEQAKRLYIPYNLSYRPEMIIANSSDYFEATKGEFYKHIRLASNETIDLPIPKTLSQRINQSMDIDSFNEKNHSYFTKSDIFINIIPEGRLYSDNLFMVWVISRNNQLLGDCSFQFTDDFGINPKQSIIDPNQNIIVRQCYFKKPEKIKGTVCNLLNGGGGVSNYFHWMVDVLPRLHLLKKAGLLESVDYFIVPDYRLEYQKASLEGFGIPADKVIAYRSILHLQADHLISTSHPRNLKSYLIPKWIVEFHKKCFLRLLDKDEITPSKVYISRKDSSLRPIYNEDELIDYLQSKGFVSVKLSELSFLEKIRLFHQADIIVGATGAGLTNLLYCKPGAKLLEIFTPNTLNTHYYNLAYHSGMDYQFVVSENDDKKLNDRKKAIKTGFSVDLGQLRQAVDKLLE